MDVYLVRHSRAKPPGEDPERGLTEAGVREAEAVARWTQRVGARVEQILHSGKKRTEETAGIFARHLQPPRGTAPARGLGPDDDVVSTADWIEAGEESVMIVGHLPFLPRLASRLVAGDPGRAGFAFMEATVVCLHRSQGRWFVRWMVTPEEVGVEEQP